MRLFKLLGIAVIAAALALPTAALAKDSGSGNGKGKGNGRGNGATTVTEHGKADKPHGDDADEAEAPEAEAPETEHGKAAKAHGKDAERGKASVTETVEGARIPTANAQRVLAEKVASGQLPPHAAEVLFRVLQKLQFKHGAALVLPPNPCVSCTIPPGLTPTVGSGPHS